MARNGETLQERKTAMKRLLKFVARISENLAPALEGVDPAITQLWIDQPVILKETMRRVFSQFPIWRSFVVSSYLSAEACYRALETVGCPAENDGVKEIFQGIDFSQSTDYGTVGFVRAAPAHLGLPDHTGAREIQQVLQRAAAIGLVKCRPTDVVDILRQYPDQPLGEILCMGMDLIEPVTRFLHLQRVFFLKHDARGRSIDICEGMLGMIGIRPINFIFRAPTTK